MGIGQFRRYTVVGVLATAVQYAVLVALVELAGAPAAGSSMAGAGCGAVAAYLGNRRHTFASRALHRVAFPRFCVVAAAGTVMNGIITWAGTGLFGLHYLVPQAIATVAVWVGGFMLNRHWTFA